MKIKNELAKLLLKHKNAESNGNDLLATKYLSSARVLAAAVEELSEVAEWEAADEALEAEAEA